MRCCGSCRCRSIANAATRSCVGRPATHTHPTMPHSACMAERDPACLAVLLRRPDGAPTPVPSFRPTETPLAAAACIGGTLARPEGTPAACSESGGVSRPLLIAQHVAGMQGNCSKAPAGALEAVAAAAAAPPLLPLRPGQCLLTSPVNFLAVRGQLWMDNLYLRAVPDGHTEEPAGTSARITGLTRAHRSAPPRDLADGAAPAAGAVELVTLSNVPGGAQLWLTRCTLQGAVDASSSSPAAAAAAGLRVTGQASADGAVLLGVACVAASARPHAYLLFWEEVMRMRRHLHTNMAARREQATLRLRAVSALRRGDLVVLGQSAQDSP